MDTILGYAFIALFGLFVLSIGLFILQLVMGLLYAIFTAIFDRQ